MGKSPADERAGQLSAEGLGLTSVQAQLRYRYSLSGSASANPGIKLARGGERGTQGAEPRLEAF